MANLVLDGEHLVVKLSPLEKLAAFRGDVKVPLHAVSAVKLDAHPWLSLRGIRAPGTGLPGVIAYGVRRYPGGKDFAALLHKRKAITIDLSDQSPFARLVVSAKNAEACVEQLQRVAGRAAA